VKGGFVNEKQFFFSKNPLLGGSAYLYKSISDVLDHWALAPAAVAICTAGETSADTTLSSVMWQTSPNSLLARRVDFCGPRTDGARTRSAVSSLGRLPESILLRNINSTIFSK
jgi:hypothetical protein